MTERYAVLAGRIRQELVDLERVIGRSERAVDASRRRPDDRALYVDSAALNLHDFYAGLERIFRQVSATVDRSAPAGRDWHRELLRQMTVTLPGRRPQVLSMEAASTMDEYLRFRHSPQRLHVRVRPGSD